MTGTIRPELAGVAREIARLLNPWSHADKIEILNIVDTLLEEDDIPAEAQLTDPRSDPAIEALAAWQLILPRTRNCLILDPVFEVDSHPLRLSDVASRTLGSLALIPNFGRICYYDLLHIMERYGWSFSPREPGEVAVPSHFFRDPDKGRAAVEKEASQRRLSAAFDLELLNDKERESLTYAQLAQRHGISVRAATDRVARARHTEALRAMFPCPE